MDEDTYFWNLLDSSFAKIAALPTINSSFKLILNEPGSGSISVPSSIPSAGLISSGMLLSASYRGAPRHGISIDNIRRNEVSEQTENSGEWIELSGSGELILLEDAIVAGTVFGDSQRDFSGTLAGVLIALMQEAQAREGCLENIDWDFTDTLDSDGVPWEDDEPFSVTVGTTLLEVLRRIAKFGIDFEMRLEDDVFVLHAYKNGIGSNKANTVIMRVGYNCEVVTQDERAGDLKNALLIAYRDGWVQVKDDSSIASNRRREKYVDAKNAQTASAATTYGSALLLGSKDPKYSLILKVYDGVAPYAFVDYIVGDTISVDISGTMLSYRIRGMQCDWDGQVYSNITLELNDIFLEHEISMDQDLSWLMDEWASAHDAGLLEVSYWAAIGDPNVTYPTIYPMCVIDSILWIGGNQFLAGYDISTGTWRTIPCTLYIQDMKALGDKIYMAALDPAASGTGGVCDNYAFVFDTVGETFELVGGGLGIADTGGVPPASSAFAVAINGTDVYFGGRFDICPTGTVGSVAKWDSLAETWHDLGAGALSGGKFVYTLFHDGTDLYAGGDFTSIGGVSNTARIAKYNGTSWVALATGFASGTVYSISKLDTDILAGGSISSGIQSFDGAAWGVFGGGTDAVVYSIKVYLADVYVAGNFSDPNSKISRYSGGQWWDLQQGLSGGFGRNLLLYNNGDGVDVYVAGTFSAAGGKPANKIAAYLTNFGSLVDYLEHATAGFDLGAGIHNATEITTLVAADEFPLWASIFGKLRKITWANIILAIKSWADTIYVALTGDQTIAGIKTFSSFPVTPSSGPSDDYEVANKKYVDDNVGGGGGTPGGSDTQVQYNNGGSFGGDSELTFDAATKALGIGDPSLFPATLQKMVWMIGDGESPTFFGLAYGSDKAPFSTFMKADGTGASPTNVKNNQVIGRMRGRGYDGSDWSNTRAEFRIVADGDWSSGDTPTRIELWTTSDGSGTLTLAMTVKSDGNINIGSGKKYYVNGAQHQHDANDIVDPKVDSSDEATLRQRMDGGTDFDYHFNDNSAPGSYTWASSPFATPTTVDYSTYPSLMYLRNATGARSFLQTSTIPTSTSFLKCFITYVPSSKYGFIGVRYDDGSDNNFVELGLYSLSGRVWKHRVYYRAGGGSESSIDGLQDITLPFSVTHRTVQYGTKWSNWGVNLDVALSWQSTTLLAQMNKATVGSRAFTPSRFGIIMRSDGEFICGVDAFGLN